MLLGSLFIEVDYLDEILHSFFQRSKFGCWHGVLFWSKASIHIAFACRVYMIVRVPVVRIKLSIEGTMLAVASQQRNVPLPSFGLYTSPTEKFSSKATLCRIYIEKVPFVSSVATKSAPFRK